jgi:hypothetical protein
LGRSVHLVCRMRGVVVMSVIVPATIHRLNFKKCGLWEPRVGYHSEAERVRRPICRSAKWAAKCEEISKGRLRSNPSGTLEPRNLER